MTTVDRIIDICRKRKIPISRLESDLGFSNAYIAGLKKGTLPNDRLMAVADYLDVDAMWLASGVENSAYSDENASLVAKLREDIELADALKAYFQMPDEKKKHIIDTIRFLSE